MLSWKLWWKTLFCFFTPLRFEWRILGKLKDLATIVDLTFEILLQLQAVRPRQIFHLSSRFLRAISQMEGKRLKRKETILFWMSFLSFWIVNQLNLHLKFWRIFVVALSFSLWGYGYEWTMEVCWNVKIVTWLILPVVICLSQRLSHACLSINNLYCETANGSLNQL